MSIKDIEKLDDTGMKAWDDHDPDAFLALFADKFEWVDDTMPEAMRTKAEAREYVQGWFTAFPDLRVKATNRVVSEDAVGVEFELVGTNRGTMAMAGREVPPTNKSVTTHGTYFARIKNGKIVQFHSHPNVSELMGQLGLMGN